MSDWILVKVKDLESAAEQIHQGYHQDQPHTWRECPRNVCHLFRYIIEHGQQADDEKYGRKKSWTATA